MNKANKNTMGPYVHKAMYSDQNRPREGELGLSNCSTDLRESTEVARMENSYFRARNRDSKGCSAPYFYRIYHDRYYMMNELILYHTQVTTHI